MISQRNSLKEMRWDFSIHSTKKERDSIEMNSDTLLDMTKMEVRYSKINGDFMNYMMIIKMLLKKTKKEKSLLMSTLLEEFYGIKMTMGNYWFSIKQERNYKTTILENPFLTNTIQSLMTYQNQKPLGDPNRMPSNKILVNSPNSKKIETTKSFFTTWME